MKALATKFVDHRLSRDTLHGGTTFHQVENDVASFFVAFLFAVMTLQQAGHSQASGRDVLSSKTQTYKNRAIKHEQCNNKRDSKETRAHPQQHHVVSRSKEGAHCREGAECPHRPVFFKSVFACKARVPFQNLSEALRQ